MNQIFKALLKFCTPKNLFKLNIYSITYVLLQNEIKKVFLCIISSYTLISMGLHLHVIQ